MMIDETKLKDMSPQSKAYAFNILAEARLRTLYQMKEKLRSDMTLEQLKTFVCNVLDDEANKQGS